MTVSTHQRALFLVLSLGLAACGQRMSDQPRYEALEASPLFSGGQSARLPPAGTVARGESPAAPARPAGFTRADLERGRQRYGIYCEPCHGVLGDGRGLVVRRGFPAPPSFHQERLRQAPLEHFFETITQGHGVMYSYADRVAEADRWRIALYIQALQQSQHLVLEDYPDLRARIEEEIEASAPEAGQSAGGAPR